MNFITESKRILRNDKNIRIKVSGNLKNFKIISTDPLDDEKINLLQTYGNYIMNMIRGNCDDLIYFNRYYKKIKKNSENIGEITLRNIISKRIEDCLSKLKTVVDVRLINDSEVYFIEKESSFYQISQTFHV
jgi:hypothetical protein